MTMLQIAIRAKLPLIAVRTNDPLNVQKVLEHYAGQPVLMQPQYKASIPALPPHSVTCLVGDHPAIDMVKAYHEAAANESTLIIVNPEEVHHTMFDAGTVHLPDSMITEFVTTYVDDASEHYALEAALRGLSFKEMVEVSQLAMAASGEFTAEAVLRVRRQRTVLSSGLQLVDTTQTFYQPQQALLDWLAVDGRLFTANVPKVVRPRGLLFDGDAGTGKTSGAKYLAHQLGVPLYLLDVGSTMQKYVGESERTFSNALTQVEALAPCVLLLDEVEKAFGQEDDSGVSRRVLGMLLWWLQEHPAQVLTIMTSNQLLALPPELIRPGRLDRRVDFTGLDLDDAQVFAAALIDSLTNVCKLDTLRTAQEVRDMYSLRPLWSQAQITQTIIDLAKRQLAASLKE